MLSNTCKYALRALIYLGKNAKEKEKIGIKKIAGDLNIPMPFLGKILQNLVRKKILISIKGPNGGFALGKNPKDISLYDIVTIIEGENYFLHCLLSLETCQVHQEKGHPCAIHNRFEEIREPLVHFYKETTIELVLSDLKAYQEIIKQ